MVKTAHAAQTVTNAAKNVGLGGAGGGSGQVKRLDTLQFDHAIAALGSANETFKSARDKINSQTRELLDCWRGDGYVQFSQTFWRLKRELDDEEELLTAMKKDLEGILETYQKWDQAIASSISGNDCK